MVVAALVGVDADEVEAFAVPEAKPSDPHARSATVPKDAAAWIRRWEGDMCNSVVCSSQLSQCHRCRRAMINWRGAALARLVGSGFRSRRIYRRADEITGGLSLAVEQLTATLLGRRLYEG